MAKPKKARLKINTEVVTGNDQLDLDKKYTLNIDGQSGNTAGTIRVQARAFFRVAGVPYSRSVINEDIAVAANAAFSLAAELPFTPRIKTVYSIRILAWDVTAAAAAAAKLKDIRAHVFKLRVKDPK